MYWENRRFVEKGLLLFNFCLKSLIKRFFIQTFYPEDIAIIKQGEPGNNFYIIRGGSVTVKKRNENGVETIVKTLKVGDYFGEQAILKQETRSATVIANGPGTECLELDRE